MWLDDDVQSAGANKTTAELLAKSLLRDTRQTHYARGNERPSSFITSAMQIVAERDTPTLQWTSVAVPALRPFSAKFINHKCG